MASWLQELRDATPVRKLLHVLDRLWVRIAAIGVLSLISIASSRVLAPLIPDWLNKAVDADAVQLFLEIIANSMLAVTTFSMTVVVTVFRSASDQWSPRVHRLMLDDQTMQNTLATLIGAYIYALASLIFLTTSFFTETQVVVMFLATIFVLVLVIVALVRWIVYLQTLGSLLESARRIERYTVEALENRRAKPCLGANPLHDLADIPDSTVALEADQTGYVQHIFEGAISEAAERHGVDIYLVAPVGRFVPKGEVIARLTGLNDDIAKVLRGNIGLGDLRTFEQDPRFGIVTLGEIASRALSPGINDPGTAIDMLGRMARVFDSYMDEASAEERKVIHPRLWVPPLKPADMIDDGLAKIARDGAAMIEVQLTLQKVLAHLARSGDTPLAEAARALGRQSYRNAMQALVFENDRDRLRAEVPVSFITE